MNNYNENRQNPKNLNFTTSREANDVVLVSLLLTFTPLSSVSVVDFEKVNVCWEGPYLGEM